MEEPKATRAPVIPQEDASSPFLKIPGVSRLVTLWRSNSQSLLSEIHRLQSLLDGMTQKVALLIAQLRAMEALLDEKESRSRSSSGRSRKTPKTDPSPPQATASESQLPKVSGLRRERSPGHRTLSPGKVSGLRGGDVSQKRNRVGGLDPAGFALLVPTHLKLRILRQPARLLLFWESVAEESQLVA